MKAYELYLKIFKEQKNYGREYLQQSLGVIRFYKNQGHATALWEDYDDPRLDSEIKTFNNKGIIQHRLPNVSEWGVAIAVIPNPNGYILNISKKQVKVNNYHITLPQNAFNYRNIGLLYFTDEEYADDFIIYLKLNFANQYNIKIEK